MKDKYLQYKKWVMKNPKLVYINIMAILLISFVLIFVQHYYFKREVILSSIPDFYSKSDAVKMSTSEKEAEMAKIVRELEILKTDRNNGPLDNKDSLRIEYLYHQYQKLKK